jgi:hypothetical protein
VDTRYLGVPPDLDLVLGLAPDADPFACEREEALVPTVVAVEEKWVACILGGALRGEFGGREVMASEGQRGDSCAFVSRCS